MYGGIKFDRTPMGLLPKSSESDRWYEVRGVIEWYKTNDMIIKQVIDTQKNK